VLSPRRASTFRHVEFLRLSDRRTLMIVVVAGGDVHNRILITERPYSQAELIEAATC